MHLINIATKIVVTFTAGVMLATAATAAPGGQLQIKGSDTVLPLAQAWAEAFMLANPKAAVSVTGGGTGVGMAGLLNGSCDVANASRDASGKEIQACKDRNSTLVGTKVAKDGLAIIVNPKNNVENLTLDQIRGLFTGKINNWKNAGGTDSKVITAGRDSSSGTYVFFQEFVLNGGRYNNGMLSLPSNNAICNAVAQSEGGIGYVGLAFAETYEAKGKVKIIRVSRKAGETGYSATAANVRSGKYPIWRYLYNYTMGKPKGQAAQYLKFCTGQEGQKVVEKVGYVPLN